MEDRCCTGCFKDEFLIATVARDGNVEEEPCHWCGSDGTPSIPASDLTDCFRAMVGQFFVRYDDLTQARHTDPLDGELLSVHLDNHFEVFSDSVSEREDLVAEIMNAGVDIRGGETNLVDDTFWFSADEDWTYGDPTEDLGAALAVLKEVVLTHGHSLSIDARRAGVRAQKDVIEAAMTIAHEFTKHVDLLAAGTRLYRARIEGDAPLVNLADLKAPPAHLVTSARANMSGEPVLYVGESADTAIAEVRPGIGDIVAVGELTLTRAVRMCPLVRRGIQLSPFQDPQQFESAAIEQQRREALGKDFARPIRPSDTSRDYLFTQYIARMARDAGLDGLVYPSSQRGRWPKIGTNYVFFDPTVGRPVSVSRHTVTSVAYEHAPTR